MQAVSGDKGEEMLEDKVEQMLELVSGTKTWGLLLHTRRKLLVSGRRGLEIIVQYGFHGALTLGKLFLVVVSVWLELLNCYVCLTNIRCICSIPYHAWWPEPGEILREET